MHIPPIIQTVDLCTSIELYDLTPLLDNKPIIIIRKFHYKFLSFNEKIPLVYVLTLLHIVFNAKFSDHLQSSASYIELICKKNIYKATSENIFSDVNQYWMVNQTMLEV